MITIVIKNEKIWLTFYDKNRYRGTLVNNVVNTIQYSVNK